MAELPLQMVLEQFASIARQQAEEGIRLIADAGQEVERLQSNLLSIQAQLDDAENIQAKKEAERVWLAKLKDVSYGIDDVLDEWNTKLQKMKIKEAEAAFNPLKKVCSSILHYLSCRPLVMRYDIGVKIKDLDRKLGIIAMEKTTFNFRPMTEGNKEIERPMTTSVFDLTQVYGREDDKNTIVDLLLSQGMQDLCIISIVGMGGIGKTTLAKFVFNDDKVSTRFEKKIWVCVSEPFDELRIAKAILESLTESKSDLRELETVVQKICQILDRKKFFLILDDVWTEDPNHWENLKSSLTCGSPESRILVTTRKEEAANAIGTTKIISLGTLPEGKCWLLFRRIAFSGETIKESNESKKIGEKLVQKCKGLPLAVKTLASLLRYKRTLDDWQHILDSEIWELKMVKQEVFRPLLLSYYDLPCILKKCFLYCAIFPKDYEIDIRNLIRLWMAHGYVKSKPNKDMESDMELVGKEYFETLSMRSFFQDFEKGPLEIRIRSCKMHDMVHDFAQFLTQNECYAKEVASVGGLELDSTYDSFKHSRIKIQEGASFPSSIYTRKTFLRSLMVDCNDGANPKIVLSKSVDQLAYLRSLSLYKCSIEEIPVEIKGLIHLRYLDLSGNDKIKKLPETLCELHNLQTLDISGCRALRKLPQGMGNLINMRCLLNWGTSISYMPKGLERLTCLRTLRFVISDGSYGSKACSIECLRNFKGLQDLGIKGFGNLTDAAKVKGIELINKKNLRDLIVDFEGSNNAGHDYEEFLEALQPPPNLMELSLRNYKGNTMFPNWMVSLNKLRKLTLQDCRKCEHLPPLGKLSSLEILSIWGMWRLKRVGNEFLGIENDTTSAFSSVIAFPKLKHLQFIGMRDWEEWNYDFTNRGDEDITVMSSLETLQITGALKLTSLPNHLRQMSTLKKEFIFCPLLDEQRTDNSSSSSASYQLQQ